MKEKRRILDRYSWQKEGDKLINPNIKGDRPEKAVHDYIEKSTKEFNKSE